MDRLLGGMLFTGNSIGGVLVKKIAFLFPGQGSQKVGMGQEFYQEHDFVREIFDMAEDITGLPITRLCFEGPMEDLTQTVNLQPAVTAVNLACLAALESADIHSDFCAGHSLGEYSALRAAAVLSTADTIRLVHKRGELMHREAEKHAGAMHAIIGLPIEAIRNIVANAQSEGVVSVANHNTELQIVISGEPTAVARVSKEAAAQGAKSVPLKVSGAWHSELIRGAEDEFGRHLQTAHFQSPKRPVILNVSGAVAGAPEEIRSGLKKQLCSPVRWFDGMRALMEHNVDVFVEVGPGKVLAGLLKKILPADYSATIATLAGPKDLESLVKEICG